MEQQNFDSTKRQYVKGSNGKYHKKNKLNCLTGKEWMFFTKTVFRTNYPSEYGHELRKQHHANKPPLLMKELVEFFTKEKQHVLDPFCGVGGTLLGASICNRKATGIEINSQWIDVYNEVCEKEGIQSEETIVGNALEVMKEMIDKGRKFHSIITDPPYSPALEKTLCDEKYGRSNRKSNLTSFSEDTDDFRNADSFDHYFDLMEKTGALMYNLIHNEKYVAIMIRDSYQEGRYINTTAEVSKRMEHVGFIPKGIKIWYQVGAPIRPYGYPYAYVPNIVHHNILVLRKEE